MFNRGPQQGEVHQGVQDRETERPGSWPVLQCFKVIKYSSVTGGFNNVTLNGDIFHLFSHVKVQSLSALSHWENTASIINVSNMLTCFIVKSVNHCDCATAGLIKKVSL